ncbi:MAG: PKD domain-containing protein, partial [Thermoplasmata archaeon]|nr:PKD domain-containing protein [Thermoplasmata archaeon]
MNYTLEYENEGKGIAFGVYFTDELSVLLNDSSLEIGPVISTSNGSIIAPPGFYDPGTRTIIWFVGEVGPAEGGYANISINVTDDAPHTSEIINYGTVYFPSVPEVTRTNGIVSMVLINQRPIAYAGNNLVVKTFDEIVFDGSGSYDSDGSIVNFTWDFGDSKSGYGKITTHSYSNDGIYTANLSVKDDKDLIGYHEIFVTVLNRLPEAKLEVDFTDVKTNENVTFDASKSSDLDGTVSDYYYDFGDGSNSGWVQTSAVSHKYSYGTATYKAKLQVKDDDGAISSNIAELEITVNNREPISELFVIPTEEYTLKDIWCGANSSTDLDGYITSYYFDFGDGYNSGWITTPWAIHQYTDGTTKYTISLEVKDNFGAVSSNIATTKILIKNRKPVALLTVDKTFIDTLEEVTMDASESYDLDGT